MARPKWSGDVNKGEDAPVPLMMVALEATGRGRNARIIELALVEIDIWTTEYKLVSITDTLINPERDTGDEADHGIPSMMVAQAPTFEEIAGYIARKIDGSVLVAHDLGFVVRMLNQEFKRVGVKFKPGKGLCTYKPTRLPLEDAFVQHGIDLQGERRALEHAIAMGALFAKVYFGKNISFETASVKLDKLPVISVPYGREDVPELLNTRPKGRAG